MIQDLRFALRQLAKSPGFTLVAVLSLALGIGANTAIFTLINAVLLRTLPVENPTELVSLNIVELGEGAGGQGRPANRLPRWTDGNSQTAFTYPAFTQFRNRNQVFSDVFAFKVLGRTNVQVNGEAELGRCQLVSANYFSALGIRPIIGRDFTAEDDRADAEPVVLISYGYWQRRFGGERSVTGKTMVINGVPFTVVGVTPPEFFGLQAGRPLDMSLPMSVQPRVLPDFAEPGVSLFTAGDHWWIELMGRLKPGVTAEQAQSQLDGIFRQAVLEGQPPLKDGQPYALPVLSVVPGGRGLAFLRNQFSTPLFILMTVVGAVLLIACANVANLLMARASARQKEIAVRLSIGASRSRLIGQLLTESVLLSSLGGIAGVVFAYWGSSLLVAMMRRVNDLLVLDLRPDLNVLGFTAAACLLTGLLFGLAPAFRATRVDLTPALKLNAATLGSGHEKMRLTKALVVFQVALSLVLLTGAGLFVRTLRNLETQNVGFTRENLLLFGIDPRQAGYKGQRFTDLCRQIQNRLAAVPGVKSTTASLHLLLAGGSRGNGVKVPGYTPAPKENMSVQVLPVGPDYLTTMGIPLMLGRDLTARDDENAPKVGMINQAMAKRFWSGQNPVGKHFMMGKLDIEVVGVVQDHKYNSLRRPTQPTVYHPFVQDVLSMPHMHFIARTSGDAAALIPAVREVVGSIDKRLPIFDLLTQTQQIDELLLQERLFAKLTTFFSLLALALVCVGLYGITSFAVTRRTSEIGIRMALGAQRSSILGMVLREVMLLVGVGATLGIAGSYVTAKYADAVISGLLFGLKIDDLAAVSFAAIVMVVVAILAGLLPARRATRVDPLVALRYE